MKEYHIELLEEEVESLLSMKEICIFESEEKQVKIFIHLPDNKENVMRENILWRYNNPEYWHEELWDDENESH